MNWKITGQTNVLEIKKDEHGRFRYYIDGFELKGAQLLELHQKGNFKQITIKITVDIPVYEEE